MLKMSTKIAVYGQGKMGLPLAQVMAQYYPIVGVDINKGLVEKLNKGVNPMPDELGLGKLIKKNFKSKSYGATTDFGYASKGANVHIIIVPTLIKNNKLDLSIVRDVAGKIAPGLKKGDVIITESTVPPGSTESLVSILEKSRLKFGEFGLAHCPERTMTGTAIRDITGQYPKIIGASDKKTAAVVKGIYEKVNKKGVIVMSSIKAAELVKVFEGCYRDVNIALANELAYVCEREGVDCAEVFNAANSQPYCHIHRPGYVGGHCIPYYPWFVIDEKTNLMKLAREINEGVIGILISKVNDALAKAGVKTSEARILVLGLTFRGGVHEFEHTAAAPFMRKMRDLGATVYAYDPLCGAEDYKRFEVAEKKDFKDIDCIVILTDHAEFSNLKLDRIAKEMKTRVLIDGRDMISPEKARNAGFDYRALGR